MLGSHRELAEAFLQSTKQCVGHSGMWQNRGAGNTSASTGTDEADETDDVEAGGMSLKGLGDFIFIAMFPPNNSPFLPVA